MDQDDSTLSQSMGGFLAQRQLTGPVLIRDGEEVPLKPVAFEEGLKKEEWLQGLLFRHPNLIPVRELEPVFDGLIPLAQELPIGGNYLDILYVNAQGYLTLVETKLWRNPEARRAVIAQIIEYAKGMSGWSYDQLLTAVRKANVNRSAESIVAAARQADDAFDEVRFVDSLTRNLRLGRFLLLIVGDGIQEGVEELAEFLNRTPQLGFTLALVEMGLYRIDDGKNDPLLVQPRILARTREVTRAIVELRTSEISPSVVVSVPPSRKAGESEAKITELQFLERLAANEGAQVADIAKWLIEQAPSHQLRLKWGKRSMAIYYFDEESGYEFSLGHIDDNGEVPLYTLHDQCKRLGLSDDIWQSYFGDVTKLVPGGNVKEGVSKAGARWAQVFVGINEEHPKLRVLGAHKEQWMAAIDRTSERIKKAMRLRDSGLQGS